MIISNIKIQNFRCYYGLNEISFNTGNKMTLIWGDSGFGKSSFLQFFRWAFYGETDFGPTNDMPLFNIEAFKEKKPGDLLEVSGEINFTHNSKKYCLKKSIVFKCGITDKTSRVDSSDLVLLQLNNDNWERCNDSVQNAINSILPEALSQYFFLDGEKARDIVLNSSGLKKAIHQLFGIEAYERAISHIGSEGNGRSVLGFYALERASKMPKGYNGQNVAEMQQNVQDMYEKRETIRKLCTSKAEEIRKLENRQKEIYKILGQSSNKATLENLLKANKELRETNEKKINDIIINITSLFYRNYSYIFLLNRTNECSSILREKNKEFSNSLNVFNSLNKEILKEVLNKRQCICGRPLDSASEKVINNIIDSMPPNSYTYQFSQFVSKARTYIRESNEKIYDYEGMMAEIASLEQNNNKLRNESESIKEELRRFESSKELVDELEKVEKELAQIKKDKSNLDGDFRFQNEVFIRAENMLNNLLKSNSAAAVYDKKIATFKIILAELIRLKNEQERKVKYVLNDCVRDVFSRLTTQSDLDPKAIQFINDDFSLRRTYLTGGQLAIDEYSYVIGIVKALQECGLDNNENPIIIDAPFAFTGNDQSDHIFRTLPLVSKQTILLTLDINKIAGAINETNLYDFYIIENNTQKSARIRKGTLEDAQKILAIKEKEQNELE